MRPFIQRRIDALHTEIERLVELEKAFHDRKHPGEHEFCRSVAYARIEVDAWGSKRKVQFGLLAESK